MIEITPNQVAPALASMFSLDASTGIRALAVLASGIAGRIFTDDAACPHWGLVWEADDGTLYRGGIYTGEVLAEAVVLLRQEGLVALGFRDNDPSVALFPPDPQAGAECLEFDRPRGSNDLSPYLGELPDGYTLQRMDRMLLELSPTLDERLHRYGGLESLLSTGIAVGILHGDEIVCEAYADMEIMGRREIGITTQAAYRRQGLATLACAHLIRLCEQAGSQAYWDCARLNIGSVSLAHKLGFQNKKEYRLLAWFRSQG